MEGRYVRWLLGSKAPLPSPKKEIHNTSTISTSCKKKPVRIRSILVDSFFYSVPPVDVTSLCFRDHYRQNPGMWIRVKVIPLRPNSYGIFFLKFNMMSSPLIYFLVSVHTNSISRVLEATESTHTYAPKRSRHTSCYGVQSREIK